MSELSHFSDAGRARMVGVSDKPSTSRVAIDRGMRIENIQLEEKRGGKSGLWLRGEPGNREKLEQRGKDTA